jgi:hypothetical protein
MPAVYAHLLLPTCEILIFPQRADFQVCNLDPTGGVSSLKTVAGDR